MIAAGQKGKENEIVGGGGDGSSNHFYVYFNSIKQSFYYFTSGRWIKIILKVEKKKIANR